MENLEKMTFDEVITEYEDFIHKTVKDEVREFLYIAHSEIVEAYKRGFKEGQSETLDNLKGTSDRVIADNKRMGRNKAKGGAR